MSLNKEDIEQSIPQRFEALVRQFPHQIAIKNGAYELTYTDLNEAANRVAQAILAQDENKETPIALLLGQGLPTVVAFLGVLKAGKFYVPLDPSFPRVRIAFILEDSGARMMVTDNPNLSLATDLTGDKPVSLINLDSMNSVSIENPELDISPDALSYILYTSGSTGKPKGVVQNHRNVLHNIMRHTTRLQITHRDRLNLFASCSTGQAVTGIYCALLNGATLFPMNLKQEGLAHLATWLQKEKITIYHSSVSVFRYFLGTLTDTDEFPNLRLVKLGSEPVYKNDIVSHRKHFPPDCLFVNTLSSTEAGAMRIHLIGKDTPLHDDRVPVGYPVEDTEILLLDEAGDPIEDHQVGEIAIKSRYLSPGYWKRPDLTQKAFLPPAREGEPPMYLTGDMGQLEPDGCLTHLGRKDFRVKIRGYGIEVAEIETALRKHEAIKETVVLVQENGQGEKRLIAYVVATQKPTPPITILRDFLGKTLPDYMIPANFVMLDAFPLTLSGKVDRQALPEVHRENDPHEEPYVAPTTDLESTLAELWQDAFEISRVSINDDFFDLGGHSLLAFQLINTIQDRFHIALPKTALFENPTIVDLAKFIMEQEPSGKIQ